MSAAATTPSTAAPIAEQHSAMNAARYSKSDWLRAMEVEDAAHFRRAFSSLSEREPGRFIDVACATSPLGRRLAALGWEAHGIELSKAGEVAAAGGVQVHAFDLAGEWPLERGTFDAVFAGEIVEHLLDTDRFVSHLRDLLAPGGTAYVTTPNLTSLENRVRSVLGVHPRFMDFGLGEDCIGHCRYFTPAKFRQLLERNGFEGVRVESINPCVSLKLRGKDVPLPGILNSVRLGSTLFATAHRPA